jgi:hypothetical protein
MPMPMPSGGLRVGAAAVGTAGRWRGGRGGGEQREEEKGELSAAAAAAAVG